MASKVTVVSSSKFVVPRLNQQQLAQLGGAIVERIHRRVGSFKNLADGPAKPYSTRGPVYVPVTGGGRTKAGLKGREVLTPKDVRKLKASGAVGRESTALGSVTPSGRSIKFANYAAYKKALGKSGNRDLELSGRMLGALTIVAQDARSVTVGFTRSEEELKARGNQARDAWFGISAQDRAFLNKLVASMVGGA